ncbi:hypothetical protein E2562_024228 [Oryza meyeriana var. granulata]|uniref:RING-type domain-containing protein n=1 Tax=Oryza meyeriana var. granulata TaxID=110450 RepID=A0A6G1E3C7_9ORYZ|nr:hypothetical protein E2562_024228 [Oryza meyeriana var. granulata]
MFFAEEGMEERAGQRTAAREPWIILPCIPHVVYDQVNLPPGTDLHLSLTAAPRASRLTVARRIAPDRKATDNHPYVAAVDQHGRFLLYSTTQGDPRPPYLDTFLPGPLGVHHGFPKAYFICNASSRVASRIRDPNRPILSPGNVGLISCSSTSFFVAELQPAPAAGTATLLLYCSDLDGWTDKELIYPPHDRPWAGNGVVSYQDRLCELPAGTPDLEKRRCVGVSAGRLRSVQIDERDGDPMVTMWTLIDHHAGTWDLDCRARFAVIWADHVYRATTLPALVPAVALIDPLDDGDVVYFFLHSQIFAVDVRTCRVIKCQFFAMLHPPVAYHSSRFVRGWKIPFHDSDASTSAPTAIASTSQSSANPVLPRLDRRPLLAPSSMSWASFLMLGDEAFQESQIVGWSLRQQQTLMKKAPDSKIPLEHCHIIEGTGLASMDKEECPLCMQPMTPDEVLSLLPCGHKFHKGCIDACVTFLLCVGVDS